MIIYEIQMRLVNGWISIRQSLCVVEVKRYLAWIAQETDFETRVQYWESGQDKFPANKTALAKPSRKSKSGAPTRPRGEAGKI